MTLNFKKNNFLIIMLLIFVIMSCIIFINMSNVKESFGNFNTNNRRYFLDTASDSSYNYYTLDTNKFKYKISTLPSGLIVESSNNVTSQNRNLTNFRTKNILLGYYNTETDVVLLNMNANVNITLDISTVPVTTNSNINTLNMVFIENSGNFYDLSNVKLSKFNMNIDGQPIIVNGAIVQPENVVTPLPNNNNQSLNDFYNDFNLYLLKQGAFGSNYVPPIYNNFETAMNLPSNPIVNPINTMNPLDYANSLFGPNITPSMLSNTCANQNIAKVTDNNTILREVNNNTNLGNNKSNNAKNVNKSNNVNSSNNNVNNNRNQNYMRESYPPYQPPQIIANTVEENKDSGFIPRPVLTDFSSFGM